MLYSHDLAAMPGAFPMPGYMPTSRQRLFVVHHKSVSFTPEFLPLVQFQMMVYSLQQLTCSSDYKLLAIFTDAFFFFFFFLLFLRLIIFPFSRDRATFP
jgi:hypothetical protein